LFKNIDSHQRINYGTEYLYNQVSSNGNQTNLDTQTQVAIAARYPDGSHWQSMALYAQYENKINQKWTLQSGVRFNQIHLEAQFQDTFFDFPFEDTQINTNAFTGSLGLIFEMNPQFFSFMNFSTAFRSPNIDDVGKIFESTPGNVVVPNNSLKSEYAWNGELGINKKLGNIFTFDAAVYYTILDNALVRRPFSFNGNTEIDFQGELSQVQAIQNAAKAYTYGFQVGTNLNFTKQWQWKTTLNWNRGIEELDNGTRAPLRHSAPFFGESHLIFKSRKWMMDGYVVYHGQIAFEDLAPSEVEKAFLYAPDSNGNPHVPDWLTLNLRQQYQFNDTWSLNVILENITDVRYRPYSSGISAAGRNLILALKVNI
jgi:hemoglobin/transferrin/lactoferrin receptor protein